LAPGPNHRAGQHEGRPKPVRPIVEGDALLDHHIEELLGTFGDVIRMGELGPDTDERLESAPSVVETPQLRTVAKPAVA
jgi:hypothetical protein